MRPIQPSGSATQNSTTVTSAAMTTKRHPSGWIGASTCLNTLFRPPHPSGERTLTEKRPAAHPSTVSKSDRKSTRLNSSHPSISYAVFCLKKKTKEQQENKTKKHHER